MLGILRFFLRAVPCSLHRFLIVRRPYAMGVAPQILEHILWASERWFRVHHSVLSEQWP
jgi:hypothetical protein